MTVTLNKEQIRYFPKDEYPDYYLYQYRPLLTEDDEFISNGATFVPNPLKREKFELGHQIINPYPSPKKWDVLKSEVYKGDTENICSGMIISWCQEAKNNEVPLLTNEEIRIFPREEEPDMWLLYCLPLAHVKCAGSFSEGCFLIPDLSVMPITRPGYQFEKECPNPRLFEVVHSEVYRGDRSNVCNGVVVCWYKEI